MAGFAHLHVAPLLALRLMGPQQAPRVLLPWLSSFPAPALGVVMSISPRQFTQYFHQGSLPPKKAVVPYLPCENHDLVVSPLRFWQLCLAASSLALPGTLSSLKCGSAGDSWSPRMPCPEEPFIRTNDSCHPMVLLNTIHTCIGDVEKPPLYRAFPNSFCLRSRLLKYHIAE